MVRHSHTFGHSSSSLNYSHRFAADYSENVNLITFTQFLFFFFKLFTGKLLKYASSRHETVCLTVVQWCTIVDYAWSVVTQKGQIVNISDKCFFSSGVEQNQISKSIRKEKKGGKKKKPQNKTNRTKSTS